MVGNGVAAACDCVVVLDGDWVPTVRYARYATN